MALLEQGITPDSKPAEPLAQDGIFPSYSTRQIQLETGLLCEPVTDSGVLSQLEPETVALPQSKAKLLRTKLGNVVAGATIAFELGPGNELVRGLALYAATTATNGNVIASVTAAGLSTLAVEGAAVLATNRFFSSESGNKTIDWARDIAERKLSYTGSNFSPVTKATAAFFGGSVVYTALRKIEDPQIEPNVLKKAGFKAAALLAGACAALGIMGPEATDFINNNPTVSMSTLSVVTAAAVGRKIRKNVLKGKAERGEWQDVDASGNRYSFVQNTPENATLLQELAVEEQKIWDEEEYGNLLEWGYGPHLEASRTSCAYDKDGNFVAINRMFVGNEDLTPPALDMPMNDENQRVVFQDLARKGLLEELGTVGIVKKWRGKDVNSRIWRMAYRDAVARGVKYWAIIMEPPRVANLNRQGFTFKQYGAAIDYQGGDCAVHIMDLDEAKSSMIRKKPASWAWFTKFPLRKYKESV